MGDFDDDDPTVVSPVGEWANESTTAPHATDQWIAGHIVGRREGIVEGRTQAFAALRLALLSVGVEPHEVEPILDRVRKYTAAGNG